ncbi:MAG: 3-oxoacyl-[acyl-carrier-protein] synthase III C-terminal domain-containing protein [Anaeromyxobacteraceae bacterium]
MRRRPPVGKVQGHPASRLEPTLDQHPSIRSVGRALPPNFVDQETLVAAFRAYWGERHFNVERLADVFRATQVKGRHLALPLQEYPATDTFKKCNDAFIRVGTDLGEAAVTEALARAGLAPADVGHLFFVTVTGVSTPSLDARLVNRLRLAPSVRRTPIFGLGCMAGAAGLSRAADWLRAYPGEVAVLLSVELCSLTLQRDDASMTNVIASGLFGDGAAAVVLEGGARGRRPELPRIVATRSVFYPDTERVMGWDVVDTGFRVVLSAKVPEVVAANIGRDVDAFLAEHGLARRDVRHWIAHTGGPKVLEAFQAALALPPEALRRSWDSLREIGNLSSASVLFVLRDTLDAAEARPGDWGVLAAMGPGFASELVLLRW